MIDFNFYPDCAARRKAVSQILSLTGKLTERTVGSSLCGRKITALEFRGERPSCLICAGVHGTEYLTVLAALRFAFELCRGKTARRVVIVPCLNPDGVEIALNGFDSAGRYAKLCKSVCCDKDLWKANARGVDINHNFNADWSVVKHRELAMGITGPACSRFGGSRPESEPETRAAVLLCRRERFDRVLALHSQGREIYYRFGKNTPSTAGAFADKMARAGGYRLSSPEPIADGGGLKDWFIEKFCRLGFTVEMGLGTNPLPLSDFETEYPLVRAVLNEFVNL